MNAVLIFPHQLFEKHPALQPGVTVYLIEEFLFFRQYDFHQHKIAFQRASMQQYAAWLQKRNFDVVYIESHSAEADIRIFLDQRSFQTIHVVDPVDNFLRRRLHRLCELRGFELHIYDNPGFLNSSLELEHFFKPDKVKFSQTTFYTQQRKARNILMDPDGKPLGGKWTFDSENRKRYPVNQVPPEIQFPEADSFYREAQSYVREHFSANPGEVSSSPRYPMTFSTARQWLQQFLDHRFARFGDYEDAMVSGESILHHSVLSPLLNTGLLTPGEVVEKVVRYAEEHDIPLNNTEGLIRQIIGWREFIRGIYEAKGSYERTRNFWGFHKKIPAAFYTGTTGIGPVDSTIDQLLKTGYNHHIERLMVLGNFMLLCEFDPDEVYRWFMELYIDAYDWVMVPNVYGMSQFADGGLMSTKPYISGSNYLLKMGNFSKGPWQAIWDGLFWRFIHTHREFFLTNPRLGMLVRSFDKMAPEKQNTHLGNAEKYLKIFEG